MKKSPAIICDIDGTLVKVGDRSPYDASNAFMLDEQNYMVQSVIRHFENLGFVVIFVSGRPEKYREQTKLQIKEAMFTSNFYPSLFMRQDNDGRPDEVVKKEIYKKYLQPNHDVKLVLDDRTKVVNMWRELGLECWQVAPGDF